MPEFDLQFFSQVLSIIVIDLVLSGDNAVVIGMAARSLPAESRRRAIILGGVGAVLLRIMFTAMAALLLGVPFLQAIGGLLLIWIAFKLVRPLDHTAHVTEASSLREAIKTIILADVIMSLDNILAVGGAAHGSIGLLLFGLALSIPILLLGSAFVARMMGRLPILVYIGSAILVVTAVRMIFEDEILHRFYEAETPVIAATALMAALAVCLYGWRIASRQRETAFEETHPVGHESAAR